MMFLDHYKPAYLVDLKLSEELGLITPGSVLAADNVIKPGNPPYLEYVRSSVADKKKLVEQTNGSTEPDPRFGERETNQYVKSRGMEVLDGSLKGNPNLVYKSELVHSFEPTGVPVSFLHRRQLGEILTDAGRRGDHAVCRCRVVATPLKLMSATLR